jgi:hypothetical protein
MVLWQALERERSRSRSHPRGAGMIFHRMHM